MAQNFTPDYNDPRLVAEKNETQAELDDLKVMEGEMLGGVEEKYDALADAAQDYADTQTDLQNKSTDLAIKELNQQKEYSKKDYIKEQAGAYADWQKQSNQYGVNAEKQAAAGLAGSGFSESSQVSMYNTYQNRVATARESFVRASTEYDNAIAEARLQNSSILAEIAYNALKTKLELSLQGFQYKNQLLLDLANRKHQIKMDGYTRWKGVLDQINTENSLKEQARQADMDNAYKQATLALQREQFEYQKSKDTLGSAIAKGAVSAAKGSKSKSNSTISKDKNAKIESGSTSKKTSGFTGKTYDEAVDYMVENGVDKDFASNVMAHVEFTEARRSGRSGLKNYGGSYADYLRDYVNYAING